MYLHKLQFLLNEFLAPDLCQFRLGPGGQELQVFLFDKYESQNQVQVQGAGSSVLPGGPAVDVVELSDGGQLPPGEVVDPDGHSRSSQGSWLSVGHPRHNLDIG